LVLLLGDVMAGATATGETRCDHMQSLQHKDFGVPKWRSSPIKARVLVASGAEQANRNYLRWSTVTGMVTADMAGTPRTCRPRWSWEISSAAARSRAVSRSPSQSPGRTCHTRSGGSVPHRSGD
jgi:hypothetical protein